MNQISTTFLSIALFLLQLFSYHWSFILTKYSLERNSKDRCYSLALWPTFCYLQRSLGLLHFFCISHVITIGWNDAGLLKCHIFALCEHRQEYLSNHSLYRKSKPSFRLSEWQFLYLRKHFSPPLHRFSFLYYFIHLFPKLLLLSSRSLVTLVLTVVACCSICEAHVSLLWN